MGELARNALIKGTIFAFLGFLTFSAGDALAKFLSGTYRVAQLIFWAQLPAILVLFCIAAIRQERLSSVYKTTLVKWHILRGCILGLQVFCTFFAFSQIPLAQAYCFIFCAPFFSVLIARFWLKEHISKTSWACLVTGFIGILIILRPGFESVEIGTLSALLAGVMFASGYIIGRHIGAQESPLTLGFYPALCGMVFAGIYMGFQSSSYIPASLPDSFLLVFLGISSVGGLLFLSWAYTLAPVPLASSFHYTQLLWGSLFGFMLFGDVPDIYTYIGAIFIIGSGVFMTWSQSKKAKCP